MLYIKTPVHLKLQETTTPWALLCNIDPNLFCSQGKFGWMTQGGSLLKNFVFHKQIYDIIQYRLIEDFGLWRLQLGAYLSPSQSYIQSIKQYHVQKPLKKSIHIWSIYFSFIQLQEPYSVHSSIPLINIAPRAIWSYIWSDKHTYHHH